MKDALPQTIYLKDYKVSPFLIETTDLVFDLGDQQTCVTTRLVRSGDSWLTQDGRAGKNAVGFEEVGHPDKLDPFNRLLTKTTQR